MKTRSVFTINLTEVIFIILLVIFLVISYLKVIDVYEQTYVPKYNYLLGNISSQISLLLLAEKEKYLMIARNPELSQQIQLDSMTDFYVIDSKGELKRIYKNSVDILLLEKTPARANHLIEFMNHYPEEKIFVFGPYNNPLTGKVSISMFLKLNKEILVANYSLQEMAHEVEKVKRDENMYLIFSTQDGIVIFNPEHKYPFGNIDLNAEDVRINGDWYKHFKVFNPELNMFISGLVPATDSSHFMVRYLRFSHILLVLILVLISTRNYLFKRELIDPLGKMGENLNKRAWNQISSIQSTQFAEVNIIRQELLKYHDEHAEELKRLDRQISYYLEIIDTSPNMVVATDNNEDIRLMNKIAVSFFGRVNEPRKLRQLFSLSSHEIVILERVKNAGAGFERITDKKITLGNEDRYFDLLIYGLTRDNRFSGLVVIGVEGTQKKLMDEQFLQSQKMETVGLLAGGFAHDFNNLLTVILGNLDFYRFAETEEKKQELIYSISEAAKKASELVNQILVFSRREQIQLKQVNLERIVGNVIKMSGRSLTDNIKLVERIETNDTFIMGNENYIMQVLLNLIVNARDAIGQRQGIVEISLKIIYIDSAQCAKLGLSSIGNYAVITVSDNGKGIDPEIRSRVFDPFFTTKTRGNIKGTGLGLSIVYGIMKKLSGSVDFESQAGEGSVFRLYFPVSVGEAVADTVYNYPIKEGQGENVLLADDDEEIRRLGVNFLNLLGYRVVAVSSGQEAVDALQDRRFSLLLIDLLMPGSDGRFVLNYMLEKQIDIPVILTTGYFEDLDEKEFEEYKFVKGLIGKPFTLSRFSQKLKEVLESGKEQDKDGGNREE